MKIKAIYISIALTIAMFSGLTLVQQESATAQVQSHKKVTVVKKTPPYKGKEPPKKVPTPALLPGLVALGIGLLRKRKPEESKVTE